MNLKQQSATFVLAYLRFFAKWQLRKNKQAKSWVSPAVLVKLAVS